MTIRITLAPGEPRRVPLITASRLNIVRLVEDADDG